MAEEQRTKGTGAMPEAIAAASADGYLGSIDTVGQLVEDFGLPVGRAGVTGPYGGPVCRGR